MDSRTPQVSGALPRASGVRTRVTKPDSEQKAAPGDKASHKAGGAHTAQRNRAAPLEAGTQSARTREGLPSKSGLAQNSRAPSAAPFPAPLAAFPPAASFPAASSAAPALPLFSDGTLQEAKEQALRSLFHSLGLPAGSLSSFLITSFVYFSLPLDSALLARIRRQLGRLASPAAAQGAAAAFDKGVRLSDETLSEYALAIDPGGSSGRQGPSGEQGPSGGQGPAEKRKSLAGAALAAELAALSGEIDPRWTLLNRLPGKSGKFWMVFPLNCSLDGVDFDITLRLLLENQTGFPLKAARLAADIITATSRRLFVLDKPGQGGEARLYLSPLPSGTEQARIKQDLYQALSPLVCGVRVLEADTFILDGEGGLPLPVDEEA